MALRAPAGAKRNADFGKLGQTDFFLLLINGLQSAQGTDFNALGAEIAVTEMKIHNRRAYLGKSVLELARSDHVRRTDTPASVTAQTPLKKIFIGTNSRRTDKRIGPGIRTVGSESQEDSGSCRALNNFSAAQNRLFVFERLSIHFSFCPALNRAVAEELPACDTKLENQPLIGQRADKNRNNSCYQKCAARERLQNA